MCNTTVFGDGPEHIMHSHHLCDYPASNCHLQASTSMVRLVTIQSLFTDCVLTVGASKSMTHACITDNTSCRSRVHAYETQAAQCLSLSFSLAPLTLPDKCSLTCMQVQPSFVCKWHPFRRTLSHLHPLQTSPNMSASTAFVLTKCTCGALSPAFTRGSGSGNHAGIQRYELPPWHLMRLGPGLSGQSHPGTHR